MAPDPQRMKKILLDEIFGRAKQAWERHEAARAKDNMPGMRRAYEDLIILLQPVYKSALKSELSDFLKKTKGMPVRAILKHLREE